jgi:hypothetical protein
MKVDLGGGLTSEDLDGVRKRVLSRMVIASLLE